jgi:hypothetical protein
METIKTLWYIRKVRVYEALVQKMTKVREGIKAKQAKYQASAEKYRTKVSESTKL